MHVQSLEGSQSPPILKGCNIHMHTTHENICYSNQTNINYHTSALWRQQTATNVRKNIYNYENNDKLRRTVPPTHHRTTVRAKVDDATYSTKAQLSSASLLKRCGSRHLQFAYLSCSGWKPRAPGLSGKPAVKPSSAKSGSNLQ